MAAGLWKGGFKNVDFVKRSSTCDDTEVMQLYPGVKNMFS